jgi:hypothetical protein
VRRRRAGADACRDAAHRAADARIARVARSAP